MIQYYCKFFIFVGIICVFNTPILSQTVQRLEWSLYHGGVRSDAIRDMTIDSDGFIYTIGSTESNDRIATSDANQASNSGSLDVYIAKYNNTGQRIWSTYFGGNDVDVGQSIAVDPQGNLLITGLTFSSSGISIGTAIHQSAYQNEGDVFVAKFSNNGNLLWSTYYGGNRFDFANDIASDMAGNAIVTGWTDSDMGISSAGAYKMTKSDTADIFVAKFNPNGQLIWGTYYGSEGPERSLQVESDVQNNIYISGWTASRMNFATNGAFQTNYGGGTADVFVGKFNPGGQVLWMTYFGGANEEYGDAMYVNSSGDVFLSGTTSSSNNISNNGTTFNGDHDVFLSFFDTNGNRRLSTYYGGSGYEIAFRLQQSSNGNVWMTGHTNSANNIVNNTNNVYKSQLSGGLDAFVTEFDQTGRVLQSTYFGGNRNEESYGIVIDRQNAVYISGKTESTNEIGFGNPAFQTFGGDADGFLAKFAPCPALNVTINVNNRNICQGDQLQLATDVARSYRWQGPSGYADTTRTPVINNITAANAGIYAVTVTDQNGCTGTDTIMVTVLALPVTIVSSNSPVCMGGEIRLQLSGGVSYQWSGPNGFTSSVQNPVITAVTQNNSGLYRVMVTGANTCIKRDSVLVAVSGQLNISISSNNPVCTGDSVRITTTGGGSSFIWSGPSGYSSSQRNPIFLARDTTLSGTYTLTVNDQGGCSLTRQIDIRVLPKPRVMISGRDSICQNNSVTLTATGIGTKIWNTGSTTDQITVSPSQATLYSLTVVQNGCRDSAQFRVNVIRNPQINLTATSQQVQRGQNIQLSATGAQWYVWRPSDVLSCADCDTTIANLEQSTEICVQGINQHGCTADTCITIEVQQNCDIVLPNIISPNQDNTNDAWCSLSKDCISTQSVYIYDRWGNKIYSTEGVEVCWNPSESNLDLQNQVFTYILKITLSDGKEKIKTGSITLVK